MVKSFKTTFKKIATMKKFLAFAVISAALVACNNESETKEETKDSTVIEQPVTPPVDTVKTDTTVVIDTTK
jgi:hypothetical protein